MNNKRKWIIVTIIVVAITNIITFFGSTVLSFNLPNGKVVLPRAQYDEVLKLQKMFVVKNDLYKYYDGKIDDTVLAEGAIKGMTAALNDPYTVFMNKKEYEAFNTQTEGSYTGIGLQVGVKEERITVISAFEDSPAKKAGILTGDSIEKVDKKDVTGKDLEKAVSMMKGPENTEVTITLSREGKGSFDVLLKRAKINLVTVSGEMLDTEVGYIKISMFDVHTGEEFNKKLKELQSKNMKRLMLDLRENPGGLLTECVDVVSNFIEKDKVIVSTIDKNKKESKYESKGGNAIGIPLVVLTDEGTASASEIVSGVVRDYKVGTLVGKKTFGKGVVQTILETGDGTALKVTISRYYTPNGENIHGTGIKPEIEVQYPEDLKTKAYSRVADPQFNKGLEILKNK